MFTKAEEQFLELYRSGIWDKPVKEEVFDGSTDWETIKDVPMSSVSCPLNSSQIKIFTST